MDKGVLNVGMVNKKSAKKDKTSSAKSSTGFSQSTEDLSQIQSTSNSAFQTSLPRASSLYSPTKPLTTCAAATNPLQTTSGSGTWRLTPATPATMSNTLNDTHSFSSPSNSTSSSPNKPFKTASNETSPFSSPSKAFKSSSTESSPYSSPNKMNTMIAYVHKLSDEKRNKRNTLTYCTLTLQTDNEYIEALLYSKSKRSILKNSQESHTPVKIERYTHTKDGLKIIINDMTYLSTPRPMEYSFQYAELNEITGRKASINELCDFDNYEDVVLDAKVVRMNRERIVGQKNYRLLTATISDGTNDIDIDIWEDHVDKIQLGGVYRFSPVQIRTWDDKKKLTTLKATEIVLAPENENQFEDIAVDENETSDLTTMTVPRIHTVQGSNFYMYCVNCAKRIIQTSSCQVIKCDNKKCNHIMRSADCPTKLFVTVIVLKEDNSELPLCISEDILVSLIHKDPSTLSEIELAQALLALNNIQLTFDNERHIINIKILEATSAT